MNKRKLAYLRRYTRVGSILFVFLLPIILFLILKSGKSFYKDIPTLYVLEESGCKNIIPRETSVLLFVVKNEKELKYGKHIYNKLTEQLRDIKAYVPPLFVIKSDSSYSLDEEYYLQDGSFRDFVRDCLQSEVSLLSPANAFLIKKSYEVGGVYALHKFTDRKKLKEALSVHLYLLKHPEYEAKK